MAFTVLAATSSGSVVPQRAIASLPHPGTRGVRLPRQLEHPVQLAQGHEGHQPRGHLLQAAVGVVHQLAHRLAEPAQHGGGHRHLEAAHVRTDAGGRGELLARAVLGVPVEGHRLHLRGDAHREPLLHRVLLAAALRPRSGAPPRPAVRDEAEADLARLALGERHRLRRVSPWSFSGPLAVAVTSTSLIFPDGAWTTTPASTLSPTRANRGSAGSARSGLRTCTLLSPEPKRSARSMATAMIRKVVRLSGKRELDLGLSLAAPVTTEGGNSTVVLKLRADARARRSAPPAPPAVDRPSRRRRVRRTRWMQRLADAHREAALGLEIASSGSGSLVAGEPEHALVHRPHRHLRLGRALPVRVRTATSTFTFSRGRYCVRSGVTSTARRLLFFSTLSST